MVNRIIKTCLTLLRSILDIQRFKKLLFILALLFFTAHPCLAATTQNPITTKKKVTTPTKKRIAKPAVRTKKQIKKPVVNKTKKKAPTRTQKKIASKKTKKKRPRQQQNRTTRAATTRTAAVKAATSQPTHINTTNISKAYLPVYLLTSIEKTLVEAVHKTIATVRYTAYKLGGTHIDPSRGIYVVDCSTYVDHVLKNVYPRAYTSLTSWSGSEKPTTSDYYQYFTNLTGNSRSLWNTIDDVEQLRPGDILVFRYKTRLGTERGGHVMIVMDKPVRRADAYLVRVADSAPTGHSTDTRMPRASGIGIGSLLLKVHPKTYQPYAYAWKVGSRWEKNVNFAMARPVSVG